jgi:hypothetical protein
LESEALAAQLTVPFTVAPLAGALIESVGGVLVVGVVALFAMVTLSCELLVAPFVSVATAFSTYAPSA